MEFTGIVLNQVIIMFLLMITGYILIRGKVITEEVIRGLCGFLLKIAIPCSIVVAFLRPYSPEKTNQLVFSFILAIVFHAFAILISNLLFKKEPTGQYKIKRLGAVYSNCAFMGFPLLAAMFGDDGIFLGSAYIAVFNILIWIHGVKTLNEDKKIGLVRILFNPGCIAIAIGLINYFFQIPYPNTIQETVRLLGSMSTPMAMIVIGGFFTAVPLKGIFKEINILYVSLLRILILPVLFLIPLVIFGVSNLIQNGNTAVLVVMVAAACPVAATVVLLPESMEIDASQGSKMLVVSTLLSILTLPLITYITYTFLLII